MGPLVRENHDIRNFKILSYSRDGLQKLNLAFIEPAPWRKLAAELEALSASPTWFKRGVNNFYQKLFLKTYTILIISVLFSL